LRVEPVVGSRLNEKYEQVVHRIDPYGTLLRTWSPEGGVSAQVTALEFAQADGRTRKLFVRRHGDGDFNENPNIATDEFNLLHTLQSAGLAVPTPYYVDQSGELLGRPYIVVEFVEGATEFAPADLGSFLMQMAVQLAQIHGSDGTPEKLSFLPKLDQILAERFRVRPARVDDSIGEGHIREVLEAVWPLSQTNRSGLLHGDFWPGNLLWRDGRLVAVIDWEDAKLGDPLFDLAIARLEILWAFGIDAMQRFTECYQAIMTAIDYTNLPYWDLCVALRPAFKISEWAGNETKAKIMRERHKVFVTQAFDNLSIR
jgi:aminoglycoside phosphotransferase (APT) family kinase protein